METVTERATVLTCRPFFRALAGLLCGLTVLGSVGLALGAWRDEPGMLVALVVLLPTAWLSGKLARHGTVVIGRSTTTVTLDGDAGDD